MKATKIIKYLTESGIKYDYNDVDIVITLETDCIWVNGYNEEMHYNKTLHISQNKYKTYFLIETTGYNMSRTLCSTGKQEEIIKVLQERLGK